MKNFFVFKNIILSLTIFLTLILSFSGCEEKSTDSESEMGETGDDTDDPSDDTDDPGDGSSDDTDDPGDGSSDDGDDTDDPGDGTVYVPPPPLCPGDNSGSATVALTCPSNYIPVPALQGYSNAFCIAKYEMRLGATASDPPVSQATGVPSTIDQADAIGQCQSLGTGYDLLNNDEWQVVARNIELVSSNWANDEIGNAGGLSQGFIFSYDDHASLTVADTADPCSGITLGAGESCSSTEWHANRRTFTLSNGEVIWDLAGNAYEWMKEHYSSELPFPSYKIISDMAPGGTISIFGAGGYARDLKGHFGPQGDYQDLNTGIYGALGVFYWGQHDTNKGGLIRGWTSLRAFDRGGLFSAYTWATTGGSSGYVGFRCRHKIGPEFSFSSTPGTEFTK